MLQQLPSDLVLRHIVPHLGPRDVDSWKAAYKRDNPVAAHVESMQAELEDLCAQMAGAFKLTQPEAERRLLELPRDTYTVLKFSKYTAFTKVLASTRHFEAELFIWEDPRESRAVIADADDREVYIYAAAHGRVFCSRITMPQQWVQIVERGLGKRRRRKRPQYDGEDDSDSDSNSHRRSRSFAMK